MPEGMKGDRIGIAVKFLETVFEPGEKISIGHGHFDEVQKRKILSKGTPVHSRDIWIKRIQGGEFKKHETESNGIGIYVRMNPTNGSDADDVIKFRHVLVEFDEGQTKTKQYQLIMKSELPCSCVLDSGGKSIHGWVRVDAKDKKEYEQRVEVIHKHFEKYTMDTGNKDPGRYSRLPGFVRPDTGNMQQLLHLKTGKANWAEWMAWQEKLKTEKLEALHFDISEFIPAYPKLNETVIYNLLRRGDTLNSISSPKAGKTLLAHDMALSVAMGTPFLGMPTVKHKVWIIDNELHKPTIAHRLKKIIQAKGTKESDYTGRVRITSLRGRLMNIYSLREIFEQAKDDGYGLVILDSLYRFYPEKFDENNNADMAKLYNTIDSYASLLDTAFVLIHHTSKGMQYGKGATDLGAGGGAQSRACDSHMTLIPHPDLENVFILKSAVRDWTQSEPFCVRKEYPLMVPAPEIEVPEAPASGGARGYTPARKATFTAKREEKYADIKEAMATMGSPLNREDLLKLVINTCTCSPRHARNHVQELLKIGLKESGKGTEEDPKTYSFFA
jgi:RecA-family ATPase